MSTPVLSPLQTRFREVMGAVATPVSVVTTLAGDEPFGTTVSAFTSLSLDPPMVLVALDNESRLLAALHRTGRFGVNVLASAQAELALTFARRGDGGRFAGLTWELESGVPRLPSGGFLACDVAAQVPGGDHTILLGHVLTADTNGSPPLTYHARTFGTHAAHPR